MAGAAPPLRVDVALISTNGSGNKAEARPLRCVGRSVGEKIAWESRGRLQYVQYGDDVCGLLRDRPKGWRSPRRPFSFVPQYTTTPPDRDPFHQQGGH